MQLSVVRHRGWLLTLSVLCFWLVASLSLTGCDCDTPPVYPEGSETLKDGGSGKTDKTPVDGVTDKVNQCAPTGTPCGKKEDCNPGPDCPNITCSGGICQRSVQPDKPPVDDNNRDVDPDLPPDQGQCPNKCSSNQDCRLPACGTRTQCLNGVCTWQTQQCPRFCASDRQCQTPACGPRIQCLSGRCSPLPECPKSCTDDSDCKVTSCGPRTSCIQGTCKEPEKPRPPVAVITPLPNSFKAGDRIALDASQSVDPLGKPLKYTWRFVSKPAGSKAAFDDSTSVKPAFVADLAGVYQVELIVANDALSSQPANVSITVAKRPIPAPVLSALLPTTGQEGTSSFKWAVSGQNFVSGAVILFNGLRLQTTFASSSSLLATLDLSTIKAGAYPVLVTNPDGQKSNALSFVVTPKPVKPVVISVSPAEAKAGQSFTLLVDGRNFVAGASLILNGKKHTPTAVTATRVTATLTLAAGTYTVAVTNPNGQTSNNNITLRVVTVQTGPILASISPKTVTAGQAFTLRLTGQRFNGPRVLFNSVPAGTVTASTATSITLTATVAAAGTVSVAVLNKDGQQSNTLSLTVKPAPPKPVIRVISPTVIDAGKVATITVSGSGFLPTSNVLINGKAATTGYVNATTLTLTVPATLPAGQFNIQVANGTDRSNTATLTVRAVVVPVLSSLNPNRVAQGLSTLVKVTGRNFVSGAQVQIGTGLFKTKFVSATELEVTVTASLTVGSYDVYVFNPSGQRSNKAILTVFKLPAPTLTKIDPTSGIQGSVLTITFEGTNFANGATGVFQGGAQNTAFVSDKVLRMTISLGGISAGSYQVWVQNPDGQRTKALTFKVTAPQGPQIKQILPTSGTIGTRVNVVVDGSGFVKGAKVLLNGQSNVATFISASTLGVVFNLNNIKAGTYPVVVENPDKKRSNAVYFTVSGKKLPKPILTSVTPTTLRISKSAPIYLVGQHFQNGAQLMLPLPIVGSIGLPANFINSTTLVVTAALPRIPFPFPAQNVQVYVKNPDGQESNRKRIRVAP